jgi:hypothetical protein
VGLPSTPAVFVVSWGRQAGQKARYFASTGERGVLFQAGKIRTFETPDEARRALVAAGVGR